MDNIISSRYWHIDNGGLDLKIEKYDGYIKIKFGSSYCDHPEIESVIWLACLSNSETLKQIAQVFNEAADKLDSETQVDKQ